MLRVAGDEPIRGRAFVSSARGRGRASADPSPANDVPRDVYRLDDENAGSSVCCKERLLTAPRQASEVCTEVRNGSDNRCSMTSRESDLLSRQR